MAFKTRKKENTTFETPQEMYADYKTRKINGPINYQSDMINRYMEQGYNKKDVAFELPTGSGKTLIGLIIGEFRRRKNQEKVVYICPNNQLVFQVEEQATEKYGIRVKAFTGKQKDYDARAKADFTSGRIIAVTNYSSLFAFNSFFGDADTIIFDDAHSAEDYIADCWSLRIKRNEYSDLFKILVENLKETIEITQYNRISNDDPSNDDLIWFDKIPSIHFYNIIDELIPIIDIYVQNTQLWFSWIKIKSNLHACNVFLSWTEILIRPFIPPTLTNQAFQNAKHRIYMSATLGNSGELERITGVPEITRLKMVDEWDNKGFGRRFFMFPEVSFESDRNGEILLELCEEVERSLILVQEGKLADKISDLFEKNSDKDIFLIKDIELTKEDFIHNKNAVAILANRFDGIDLVDDDCRLLIILGLPRATHLQEKFLINRMAANVLFHERIKTRIVQAVGRCTRSPVDYAAVCVFSHDLVNALISPKKLELYHPELQAEIEFGYEQSLDHDSIETFIDNLKLFLKRGEEWDEAEEEILSIRDEKIKSKNNDIGIIFDKLLKSAKHEVKCQYALWKKDYEGALREVEILLTNLDGDELKGYRGYWNYIGGSIAYLLFSEGKSQFEQLYKSYLRNASSCTDSITWFNKLIQQNGSNSTDSEDYLLMDNIQRIELQLSKDGIRNNKKFETRAQRILKLLKSNDGTEFEQGHKELGELLGYISDNANGNSEPDPWWIINENICVVSEDKIYQKDDKPIPTKDVRQATTHETWIRDKIVSLKSDAKVLTIMISNSKSIECSAAIYAKNIYYVNREEFYNWAIRAIEGIRKLRRTFSDEGNLVWRMEAGDILKESKITPKDFLDFIMTIKLADITNVG